MSDGSCTGKWSTHFVSNSLVAVRVTVCFMLLKKWAFAPKVSHSAYISRFILGVLTFLPLYAYFTCYHPSGVVVLRNFRFSQRCCWRFPHFWLWRTGDCCLDNNLWGQRNVGPYTSIYTASRPELRESEPLLHLLQPSCLLCRRIAEGASHNWLVFWTYTITDKISNDAIDCVEFTKALVN